MTPAPSTGVVSLDPEALSGKIQSDAPDARTRTGAMSVGGARVLAVFAFFHIHAAAPCVGWFPDLIQGLWPVSVAPFAS